LKLTEYEYKIRYKAGKTNVNADTLSRNPAGTDVLVLENKDLEPEQHIYPLEFYDSDNEPIFETQPGDRDPASKTPAGSKDNVNIEEDIAEPLSSDESESQLEVSDSNSEDSDDESLFETLNAPYVHAPRNQVQYHVTPDNILLRNDNLVVFATQNGEPCDKGTRALAENNEMPIIKNVILARARLIPRRKGKHLIILVIKNKNF